MTQETLSKTALKETLWKHVEPELYGYGKMIDILMDHMDQDQLEEVLVAVASDVYYYDDNENLCRNDLTEEDEDA